MREGYLPEIDVLRAVAVLSVVFYHLEGYVPFGWVGVDIFFVISGFVVTRSILANSLRRYPIATFYVRRVKRLFPAFIFTVGFGQFLIFMIIPSAMMEDQGQLVRTATIGVVNYALDALATDYFAENSEYLFFTHYWSLSVEEQFYLLIAPLLILTRARTTVVLILTLTSLLLWILNSADWSFATQFRFWELGVGVLLALLGERVSSALSNPTVAVIGVGLTASALFVDYANIPAAVLGTVLLTGFFGTRGLDAGFWINPFIYVGKLSYSLYLIHWPIFVAGRWLLDMSSIVIQVGLLVAVFTMAAAMYHLLENPLRHRSWSLTTRSEGRWVTGIGLGLVVVAISLSLEAPRLSESLTEDAYVPVAFRSFERTHDWGSSGERCHWRYSTVSEGEFLEACLKPNSPGSVLYLLGDSHATQLHFGLEMLAEQRGFSFRYIHNNGIPTLLDRGASPTELDYVLNRLQHGDVVAITMFRGKLHSSRLPVEEGYDFQLDPITQHRTQNLRAGLLRIADLVESAGAHLVLIDDGPRLSKNVRAQVCEALNTFSSRDLCALDTSRSKFDRRPLTDVFKSVAETAPAAAYVDYHDEICGSVCSVRDEDGSLLMIDHNHISKQASLDLVPFWLTALPQPFGNARL